MLNMTPVQADILKELINIGVGRAAGALSELTGAFVRLQVPFVNIFSTDKFKNTIRKENVDIVSAVQLQFGGSFSGTANLMFPPDSAAKLVAAITGEEMDSSDMDSVKVGTLNEIGNIVINGVMGSIGNILGDHLNYSVPNYIEDTIEALIESTHTSVEDRSDSILLARTKFSIERFQVNGDVLLMFEVGSFDALLCSINEMSKEAQAV